MIWLGIGILVVVISILWPWILGAAWDPMPKSILDRVLEMARVRSDDRVYDLGCGDGRVIIRAAQRYHCQAQGIEVSPLRVLYTWLRILVMGLGGQVRVSWGNLFHKDLSQATVVVVFLTQAANDRLKPKLERELRPGTRVVSYHWQFPGWRPALVDRARHIYLYYIM